MIHGCHHKNLGIRAIIKGVIKGGGFKPPTPNFQIFFLKSEKRLKIK